jgi:hypothetical protein
MPIRSAAGERLFLVEAGASTIAATGARAPMFARTKRSADIDLERPACLRTVPTACGQAQPTKGAAHDDKPFDLKPCGPKPRGLVVFDARRMRNSRNITLRSALGAILPLHDVR